MDIDTGTMRRALSNTDNLAPPRGTMTGVAGACPVATVMKMCFHVRKTTSPYRSTACQRGVTSPIGSSVVSNKTTKGIFPRRDVFTRVGSGRVGSGSPDPARPGPTRREF